MLLVMLDTRESIGLFRFWHYAWNQVLARLMVSDEVLARPLLKVVALFALRKR
jgi:hypothetical protein